MHHYPFHVGDYIRATAHLDIVEDCIYRRLIDLYMETELPIPNETQQVIRRLRLGSSGLILETILHEFFTLETDNCWHSSRCDAEIMEYKRLAEVSRSNGKLGGRPKKTQRVILDNPEITQKKPSRLQPITNNQEPRTNSSKTYSDANASGDKPQKLTEPEDIIFGYGVTMLVSAGIPDKQARSFLGGLRKGYGDDALIDKLRECAKAKPLQPVEWLAAALPPGGSRSRKTPPPENFSTKDYGTGVNPL